MLQLRYCHAFGNEPPVSVTVGGFSKSPMAEEKDTKDTEVP